jgi:hypothetical protein
MYKRILYGIVLMTVSTTSTAQQLIKAVNCRIVSSPGTQLVVNGGILFSGSSSFTDSGTVIIAKNTGGGAENWTDSTATGAYAANSTGLVRFVSDSFQRIYGASRFYDVQVDGDSGLRLNTTIEVRNLLLLDRGLVYTDPGATLYLSNPIESSLQSSTLFTQSWVHGRFERAVSQTGTTYLFPVGKIKAGNALYGPVRLDKVNTTTARYVVEYFPDAPPDRTNIMSPPIDHISEQEYWTIISNIPSGPTDDAKVLLSWRDYSQVSTDAQVRDSLVVAQYVNAPPFRWDVPGGWATGNAVGGSSSSGYVVSNSAIGSFIPAEGWFTLGSLSRFNALPLALLQWSTIATTTGVHCKWEVAQEQDLLEYGIQHATDGSHFTTIATRPAQRLAAATYQWLHVSPATGWNYYRLEWRDRFGKIAYSPVRKAFFSGNNRPSIVLFPNPAHSILSVKLPPAFTGATALDLFDATGKWISCHITTTNMTSLAVANLPAGRYYLKIVSRSATNWLPFIKE